MKLAVDIKSVFFCSLCCADIATTNYSISGDRVVIVAPCLTPKSIHYSYRALAMSVKMKCCYSASRVYKGESYCVYFNEQRLNTKMGLDIAMRSN